MFRRLPEVSGATVSITIDGRPFEARSGDSIAVAMLAAGMTACRSTAVSGAPRGPYCMIGVCFDCLVTVDGRPNQQACVVPVSVGMRIERQTGAGIAATPVS